MRPNQIESNIFKGIKSLSFHDNFGLSSYSTLLPDYFLPSSLLHLTFGIHFNQPVDLVYLSQLTHLTFGLSFKQPLDNKLPSSLTHLSFLGRCGILIKNYPPKITHLDLGLFLFPTNFPFEIARNKIPLYALDVIKETRPFPPSLISFFFQGFK